MITARSNLEIFFEKVLQSIEVLKQFKGVGDAKIEQLKNNNIHTLWDLLIYPPQKITDIVPKSLNECAQDEYCFVKCKIGNRTRPPHNSKLKNIIEITDDSGNKGKLFFTTRNLPFTYKFDETVILYGKFSYNTFIHPKIYPGNWLENNSSNNQKSNSILKQYFLNKNHCKALTDSAVQQLIELSLSLLPQSIESPNILQNTNIIKMLFNLHFGNKEEIFQAKKDLIILEAIAYHKAMQQINKNNNHIPKTVSYQKILPQYEEIFSQLKNSLTQCQKTTLSEIEEDFKTGIVSQRMIFGDVGTGKTRVILLASLYIASGKKQTLILCPTTILAKQHFHTFQETLRETGLKISLAIQKTTKHESNYQDPDIIIGTHALFQHKTTFGDIGLIVIDEQHKFGVKQRYSLLEKQKTMENTMQNPNSNNAHTLSLSATPIPRSLMMIFQQYTSVSTLHTKPKPVQTQTLLISLKQKEDLMQRLQNISSDTLIYWICPAIEESEHSAQEHIGYANVTDTAAALNAFYPNQVACIHGAMKEQEQEEIYNKALNGELKILVSTTVLEVGIDIPRANIIVIENAERFGLSQLHQLRGRVGRHGKEGICILLHKNKLSEVSEKRLKALKTHSNGFELAEKDMEIRGHGNILGTEQSGFYDFKLLNLFHHTEILNQTYQWLKKNDSGNDSNIYNILMKCFFSTKYYYI